MIKKLRIKFIATAMCSVFAVLAVIIGAINIANYCNINERADRLLSVLESNGGYFPKPGEEEKKEPKKDKLHEPKELSPEAPFDTRYFTVTLSDGGELVSADVGKIAAVSENDAVTYAKECFQKNKTGGFKDNYKFSVISVENGRMYIFVDCSQSLSTFKSFLYSSLLASTAGLIMVFILVLIFSRAVVRPLEESYQKQKRFITDAGHEIKTPLTIIDANAEVLEMEVGENEWIRSIKNQVKRLSELTGKLVFLSKMDEESNILNFEDFSLSDAVSETAFPFETMAKAQNKELSINIEPNIIYRGDEYSICRLVSVLLDNAIKYSPDGGKTELSLSSDGKQKRLRVKNSVEKIEKGDHSVLFERFYRSDESRNSQTGGHGIGLSIAKAIVTAHKGKISAHSEDGKSIEFTVIL